jgi:sucrose phosphorylase
MPSGGTTLMEVTAKPHEYLESKLDFMCYMLDPDYTKPILQISQSDREKLFNRLRFLYGEKTAAKWVPELERILKVHHAHKTEEIKTLEQQVDPANRFTERDIALITYGDLLVTEEHSPLTGLSEFLDDRTKLDDVINILHILPFFPYSSDRGFSITDFWEVNPKLGSWGDIERMTKKYRMMFDGVFNHISAESRAFKEMLNGNSTFKDIAIVFRSPDELTPEQRKVLVRPRTSDILTKYYSIDGPIWVWTTFSPDQIDLNFKNPFVLAWVANTLLMYVRKGANLVRLDAVTYLWSELGTSSANLTQTHEIIKLLRDVLDIGAPNVALVTETNVPHEENVSYFGNGYDEAQMVYNFTLPPLVLYTFYAEDATKLSRWAENLEYPTDRTTFFNILDTHDGVGLMGVKGILTVEEIQTMIERAKAHGAFVSYKALGDGGQEPYEINTTWYGALNDENDDEPLELKAKRFVASRSIALALRGVPGIYFHGLIGTGNDPSVVERSGIKRDINRVPIVEKDLLSQAKDPGSKLMQIVTRLLKLLEIRTRTYAFHPNVPQRILGLSPQVFSLVRAPGNQEKPMLAITNISSHSCKLKISREALGIDAGRWHDMVRGITVDVKSGALSLELQPYDVAWLMPV